MGNKLITGASQLNLNAISTSRITNSFFSEFVVEWSMARVILARERYQDDFNLVPLQLADLMFVIPNLHEAKAKYLFDVFSKHCGSQIKKLHSSQQSSCDGLSLLAGICMDIGHAQLLDRLKFVFVLYDFDQTHTLNLAELTMMVRTTLGGMAALCDSVCPEIEDLHRVAQNIFKSADTNRDGAITLDEFIDWASSNKEAQLFFTQHQQVLKNQIKEAKSNPNQKGSTELSHFEEAEAQLLNQNTDALDLKNHYLGDGGLRDLIEDLRSHSKHADNSITRISLQGNGISSKGATEFLHLLNDAAADRYGSLGHYLGSITSLDLRNNSRIENDVGPVLLKMLSTTLENVEHLYLSGTKLSTPIIAQIDMLVQGKTKRNKDVKEAKQEALTSSQSPRESNGGDKSEAVVRAATRTNNSSRTAASPGMLVTNLKKHHRQWKKHVSYKMENRSQEQKSALLYLKSVANSDATVSSTKTKAKWQKYTEQGDLTMYNNSSALERERLQANEEIIAIIDHWWSQVILAKYDKNHDELLEKEEYMTFHRALGRALSDPNVEMDAQIEQQMAEEDWLLDTKGANTMNENML